MSPPSNNDFANVNSHTYEVLATPPAFTTVKAQHLIELRQAVNGLCDAVGAPQQYTPAELLLSSLQAKVVEDEDFTSLMTRINNIRTNALLAMPAASFTNTPAPSGLILREHLQSLRNALN